jgi:Holliday junction DNA helicase RuvB
MSRKIVIDEDCRLLYLAGQWPKGEPVKWHWEGEPDPEPEPIPEPEPTPEETETEPQDNMRADPPTLADVIGNPDAVSQIQTILAAHRTLARTARREAIEQARSTGKKPKLRKPIFPHTLLTGPAGLGKSMLSHIIGRELRSVVHLQMGQAMGNPAKVAEVLCQLKAHDILFIDEIHGLRNPAQEALYLAMEDGLVIPPTRAGKDAKESKPIRLPPFTIIGATTDAWGLLPSLLRRFKFTIQLARLTAGELSQAIAQRARQKGIGLTAEAAKMIGGLALGRPGIAVNMLTMCHYTALAGKSNDIDAMIVEAACETWQIDRLGLDRNATEYLRLLQSSGGGPVKLNVLAARLDGLARRTVETRIEPDLVWLGLIEKQTDGRVLTSAGRKYLDNKD